MTDRTIDYLDLLVCRRINRYLSEIITCTDDVLSADDIVAAAHHGVSVYKERTNWTHEQCDRRALEFSMHLSRNFQPIGVKETTGVGWPE